MAISVLVIEVPLYILIQTSSSTAYPDTQGQNKVDQHVDRSLTSRKHSYPTTDLLQGKLLLSRKNIYKSQCTVRITKAHFNLNYGTCHSSNNGYKHSNNHVNAKNAITVKADCHGNRYYMYYCKRFTPNFNEQDLSQ